MIDVAKDTIAISDKGEYTLGRMIYKLNNKDDTDFYFLDALRLLPKLNKDAWQYNTKVIYLKSSTVSAIYRYSNVFPSNRVGVLNFASARHAGGGFLNGAMAQEESLAYCSNLYKKQTTSKAALYYVLNETSNNAFYEGNMLMSNVTFFKNDKYELVKPFTCQVLTVPAVNVNLAKNRGFSDSSIEATMKDRMRDILNLFVARNCDIIILGAFGCGVFGNSPETVARLWNELLYDEGLSKYFSEIVFAIYDRNGSNNYETFLNMRVQ